MAAMVLSRLVLPGMLDRKEGCIINVASGSAMLGMPLLAPYCTSKTALVRFSEALAIGVYDRGVTVFSMTPGNIATKLTGDMYEKRHEICDNWPDGFTWTLMAGHCFRDHGWYPPERGADLMRFLASGKADRLTGRFFSVHYDEKKLVAEADRIEREQLYALRFPTLDGVEPPILYKKPTVFYSKDAKVGD
jgi:NAD(P)-dependent dehydrogenase (short-subunit alcohol dehydrogenase family)